MNFSGDTTCPFALGILRAISHQLLLLLTGDTESLGVESTATLPAAGATLAVRGGSVPDLLLVLALGEVDGGALVMRQAWLRQATWVETEACTVNYT